MRYLLNLLYLLLIAAASPWLLYSALRHGKYRQGWGAKFFGRVPIRSGERRCVWLHAVSVGEVNLLKPLITAIEQRYPDWECVITTTTRTGYELARKKYAPRNVCYCPLDFTWAVSAALRRLRPDVLILAELELWPNLISAAKRRGVSVAVVNGRLSRKSWQGYSRVKRWVAAWLKQIDLFVVQNKEYAERFVDLGAPAERVRVTGSMKFDGAQSDRLNPLTQRLATLVDIQPDDVVFLAGSTQHPEEALAIETYKTLAAEHPQLRLMLVPRHPERFGEVADLLSRSGVRWQRRSEIERTGLDREARVLLIDTVGELGGWWGTARLAFVGGSMGSRGGQNMIEPAAYGAAVSFGTETHNFRDVVGLLLGRDAATVVRNGRELTHWVRRCLTTPEFVEQQGQTARQLVFEQQGATNKTLEQLAPLFTARSEPTANSKNSKPIAA